MKNTLEDFRRKTPSLYGNDIESKRQEILDYFLATFELFEKLFDPLVDEKAFYKSPEPTRHPIIFYYGHTATFFINKLMISKAIDERVNANFESMFAIGVDEMRWDDMNEKHYAWPKVSEVKAYRDQVKAQITHWIKTKPMKLPISWDDSFWWVILMGIEHERIHLETSSVLHRQLDVNDVKPDAFWPICDDRTEEFPKNSLVDIPAGRVTLGKDMSDDYYGWDNEYGEKSAFVEAFKISKYLVSNGEFMEFVLANGYKQQKYWSQEGWVWLQEDGRDFPHFWMQKGENFRYRSMLEMIDMPMNWPVDINYHEAHAFCHYKSEKDNSNYRLLSELEWYRLADHAKVEDRIDRGNIDLSQVASSQAVDRHQFEGVYDVVGNVWQWTEAHMDGLEGFKPHFAYDDFSTPTFDNKHNLDRKSVV